MGYGEGCIEDGLGISERSKNQEVLLDIGTIYGSSSKCIKSLFQS